MRSYCCRFHDETVCQSCETFNVNGLFFCWNCGSKDLKEPSIQNIVNSRGLLVTRAAIILPLKFKSNRTYRGKVTGEEAKNRSKALKHHKRAVERYGSIVNRWDNDKLYRDNCINNHMTREDAIQLDVLAAQQAPHHGMSFQQRRQKNTHYRYRIVQEGSAGGQTVSTELHPGYDAHRAKAKAKTMSWTASSSSTAWSQQRWTTEDAGWRWRYW